MHQSKVNTENSSKSLFLGIGECMVELSQSENGLLRKSFAGDVFNTLWYFEQTRNQSWRSGFMSALGDDPMSAELRSFITNAGISAKHVQTIKGKRPGLYMIHLDRGERSFSYWRNDSAAKLLASDTSALENGLNDASVIYLSGITLAILSKADFESLFTALKKAKSEGKKIAFDPNIRPALWDDQKRMLDSIMAVAGMSDFVLPGYDDEAKFFGDKSPEETIARYLENGSETVILKNGPGDVLVSDKTGNLAFTTPRVTNVVDTTAAGDSFNGAFFASYLAENDMEKAVAAGQQCAAKVISHHGALVRLSEV